MNRVLIAVATCCALASPIALADLAYGKGREDRGWDDRGRGNRDGGWRDDRDRRGPVGLSGPYRMPPGQVKRMWRQGERIPGSYLAPRYYVVDHRAYRLAAPRRGHRWVVVDRDAYLVDVATGVIASVMVGAIVANVGYAPPPPPPTVVVVGREDRWRKRYARTYTYTDDSFYTECRQSADPAGVIGGALIGGLVGNAVGRDGRRAGSTLAGVIVGGAIGGALTRRLDCTDRSYAYKTYHDGFNSGRPNSAYQWRNPNNGHYGTFRVGTYYDDPDGFRCANYTQQIFVDGRPEAASGRACQQPDGTWTIVS